MYLSVASTAKKVKIAVRTAAEANNVASNLVFNTSLVGALILTNEGYTSKKVLSDLEPDHALVDRIVIVFYLTTGSLVDAGRR